MRAKKLFVIFLAAVCMLAVALSCVFIFAIEEINVEFAVGEQTDVSAVSQTIDEYTGKNLLFADLDEIKNDLKKYPYFKVESIKKNYPNGIDITLSERVEVYWFVNEGVYYFLHSHFLLNTITSPIPMSRLRSITVQRLKAVLYITISW